MPEEKDAKSKPVKYEVHLITNEQEFDEVQKFSMKESEKERNGEYNTYKSEIMAASPGLAGYKGESYVKHLNMARGIVPEKLKKRIDFKAAGEIAVVARDKETGEICGYAMHVSFNYGLVNDRVYVPPKYRGHGIAIALHQTMEDTAKEMGYPFLELKVQSEKMRKHLKKIGYKPIGEDTYYMRKDLSSLDEMKTPKTEKKQKDESTYSE